MGAETRYVLCCVSVIMTAQYGVFYIPLGEVYDRRRSSCEDAR